MIGTYCSGKNCTERETCDRFTYGKVKQQSPLWMEGKSEPYKSCTLKVEAVI